MSIWNGIEVAVGTVGLIAIFKIYIDSEDDGAIKSSSLLVVRPC
jgi:hypothetical protein